MTEFEILVLKSLSVIMVSQRLTLTSLLGKENPIGFMLDESMKNLSNQLAEIALKEEKKPQNEENDK